MVHGLGGDDNPVFPRMHEAARHVVGASIEAARQVWTGQVDHAANIAGGLHHAMPDRVSGFCVYNDVAVAIKWLLANGVTETELARVHGPAGLAIGADPPPEIALSILAEAVAVLRGAELRGSLSDTDGPIHPDLPPGTATCPTG